MQVFTIASLATGGLFSENTSLTSAIELATVLKMHFGPLEIRPRNACEADEAEILRNVNKSLKG
jgi:hypothetical protein